MRRKCLRKFLTSLESRRFSSVFLSIIDHGAWEKSDHGWTCGVRLARKPPPSSLSSPFAPRRLHVQYTILYYTISSVNGTSRTRAHSAKVLARRRFLEVRTTTKATASDPLTRSSWPSDAMKGTYVLCRCSKCCVPRIALLCLGESSTCAGCAAMLCRGVTSSYFRRLPKTRLFQSETANTNASDLHRTVFGSQIRWSLGAKNKYWI